MKNQQNNRSFVSFALHILGFLLCIVPPTICTLLYFPLWKASGYTTCIAGGTALILALCIIPLYKMIKRGLMSFSSYMMWLILFLLFLALSKIADQMTVISFVGFIGNLLGAVCFYFARREVKA